MELNRRQLARLARQAANTLVGALEHKGLVARFAEGYIEAAKRPELKANTEQYRETLGALRREALLCMLLHAEAVLPRYLPKPKRRAHRDFTEAQAVKIFRESLLEELARTDRWNPNDVFEFRRDLAIYESLTARRAAAPRTERRPSEAGGPFADRCALLLDPSMLERARAAANRFRGQLMRLATRALREVFQTKRRS
ncbi:MAG: hypothetical protein K6U09_07380 [Acidobacteriia bacterium]|jgi:hypothetical protein|nr:hypothetical protein [Terriglobia bacterium]